MRCNNCGWDNEPGATACTKCGCPIQSDNGYADSPYAGSDVMDGNVAERPLKATVVSSPGMLDGLQEPKPTVIAGANGLGGQDLRATVMDSAVMDMPDLGAQEMRKTRFIGGGDYDSMDSTPQPMDGGEDAEPYAPVQAPAPAAQDDAETVECEHCHAAVSAQFAFCPMCGTKLPEKPRGPFCSLTLIPDEGEQIDSETLGYEGETVVLNRANTEKTNHTITSREQAVLINEEGRWFLENRSEMCSTYFEVNRRMELFKGDVIMLGDRRFRFDAE